MHVPPGTPRRESSNSRQRGSSVLAHTRGGEQEVDSGEDRISVRRPHSHFI